MTFTPFKQQHKAKFFILTQTNASDMFSTVRAVIERLSITFIVTLLQLI